MIYLKVLSVYEIKICTNRLLLDRILRIIRTLKCCFAEVNVVCCQLYDSKPHSLLQNNVTVQNCFVYNSLFSFCLFKFVHY